jgi:hypothetical protein
MTPYQAIGYSLSQATAVTALVSTRIYHGNRPEGTGVPCINYYEIGSVERRNGIEIATYSINCRATDPGTARTIARKVLDLFIGASSNGTYGNVGATGQFEVSRASLQNDAGLIIEPSEGMYNAPVDIRIVYPTSTVS